MTQEELNERIKKHKLWLNGEEGGEQFVVKTDLNLYGLDFSGEDLELADLAAADLSCSDFTRTCLFAADLQGTCFDDAIFDHTYFDGATITYDEDLILKFAEDIKKSRQEKSPSDTSAQAASAKAD